MLAALYPELLPGYEIPASCLRAVQHGLNNIADHLPTDQIGCLEAANAAASGEVEKIIVLRAALTKIKNDTLWLHYDITFSLFQLLERGVAEALPPCLMHAMLVMQLNPGENSPAPFMRKLLGCFMLPYAPREAILNASLALRGGQSDAMPLLRDAALQLGVVAADSPAKLSISALRAIEDACALPRHSGVNVVSTQFLNLAGAPALPPARLTLPAPRGDAFYHVFRAAGRPYDLPPISVYSVQNGTISFDLSQPGLTQFYVFDGQGACIENLSHGAEPFIAPARREVAGALGVTGDLFCGPMNVCHFLLDHLTRAAIYDRAGETAAKILFVEDHPAYRRIVERAGLLDRAEWGVEKRFSITAERLLVASNITADFRHPAHHGAPWALEFVRNRLAGEAAAQPWRRIFISRDDARARQILNWAEVEPVLRARGFELVNLSELDLAAQIETFAQAQIVAGVHGAGLANAVFSPPGLKMLEILPPLVATAAYWMLCHGAGHDYTAMVADDPEMPRPDYASWGHHPEFNDRNILVDTKRLGQMLDEMIIQSAAPEPGIGYVMGEAIHENIAAPAVMSGQLKTTVIANCHCLPLADALALGGAGLATEFIDVTFFEQPHMVEKTDHLLRADGDEMVFAFNLSEQFGRLATPALRAALGDRLRTFTNIHFAGLHPDMTYLGPMKQRIAGFLGDYHSKIVLFAFVAGLREADCLALFNGEFYRKTGYFDAFGQSSAELLHRDNACDVKFAPRFLEMLREQPCLFTINHPTGAVFLELAERLAQVRGLDFAHFEAPYFQNHLAASQIWPVYHEIAEQVGLKYRSPPFFVKPAERNARRYGFGEFIAGSYAAYRQAPAEEFVAMVKNLPFFGRFAGAL